MNSRSRKSGDWAVLVEIMGGEISRETRQAILELGDPPEFPPAYGQLIESIQGSTLESKALTHELQKSYA